MSVAPFCLSLFFVKTHGHSLEVRSREKLERGVWVGWECFLFELPTRPSPFMISFLACALDPLHCSYTNNFSPILNQLSMEQRPVGIYYSSLLKQTLSRESSPTGAKMTPNRRSLFSLIFIINCISKINLIRIFMLPKRNFETYFGIKLRSFYQWSVHFTAIDYYCKNIKVRKVLCDLFIVKQT